MGKRYLFSSNPTTGESAEVKVDPKHLDRQIREEQDLIAAKGNPQKHAEVRDQIREAGLPQLAAELGRIAGTDPQN